MKILYALQATGNGHLARANVLIPKLQEFLPVDVLVSGTNAQLKGTFEYKKYQGISLFYSGNGGLDFMKIVQKNSFSTFAKNIRRYKIKDYSLVINDFEPITAWASKLQNVPTLALSHQWAVKHTSSPKPKKNDFFAQIILEKYAPSREGIGFHFKSYHSSIYLPLLREQIVAQKSSYDHYYLVYLPSYHHDELISFFQRFPSTRFVIFSPMTKTSFSNSQIEVRPIDGDLFIEKLLHCEGVICNAGFELPSEALYLKKKLYVIPIAKQYEQLCNYTALKKMGVDGNLHLDQAEIASWLKKNAITNFSWEDQTDKVIGKVLQTISKLPTIR